MKEDCLSEVILDLKKRQLEGKAVDLAWAKGWAKRCRSKGHEIIALYGALDQNGFKTDSGSIQSPSTSFIREMLIAFFIGASLVACVLWIERADVKAVIIGGVISSLLFLVAKRFLGIQLISAGLGMLAWGHFDWEIWYPDHENPIFQLSTYRSTPVHLASILAGGWLIFFGVKQIRSN